MVWLFALTLVAPWAWQSLRDERPVRTEASRGPVPQPAAPVADLRSALAAPTMPPLVEPDLAEPIATAPAVTVDDYVAVDEPLLLVEPAVDPVLPTPTSAAAADAQPTTPLDPFRLNPNSRSVLVAKAPAAPAAARLEFCSVESLLKLRESFAMMIEHVRRNHPPAAAPSNPLRVVVTSEHERLAMIPPASELPTNPPALVHLPAALIAELEALAQYAPAAPWARRALANVELLSQPSVGAAPMWQPAIDELRTLARQGAAASSRLADPAVQTGWLRAARSLSRRLPVWEALLGASADPVAPSAIFDRQLSLALEDVAAMTAGSAEGQSWRDYLRLDELFGLTSVGGANYAEIRRATARDVLVRIDDPRLTPQQREFLAQTPIDAMAAALRPWASGEVSLETLAGIIERYESFGRQRDADAIAELRLRMKWSADPRLTALGEQLDRDYRNANLRVAVSSDLINRLIPEQQSRAAAVRQRIAGAEVRGRSETSTEVRVRLLPDDSVLRFGLEARGEVLSRTRSETWPARLHNSSRMEYEARKLILVNRYGMHAWPAEVRADGRTSLVGVDTEFDRVPIVGGLVKNAARKQHYENRSRAIAQVRTKVTREVAERMDAESGEKFTRLQDRFQTYVMEPLERFGLELDPVGLSTAEDRAVVRLRMATEQQLAAHTPRPSAPSDSLASIQLHESVLNNSLRGLELDGRRLTVGELHATLSEKIRRHAESAPADLPARAKVEFAPHDAVRMVCRGDRIELILNIVELRHGRDSIRNVGVHAFFRPVVEGIELKLVRDGSLHFDGAHLRTGPRLVLHSVFGKLLPKHQEVPVLAAPLGEDPRLAGLMVTQLVIDDGWLAVSVGPATPSRTAWRTRVTEAK